MKAPQRQLQVVLCLAMMNLTAGFMMAAPAASALKQYNVKYAPKIRKAQARGQEATLNKIAQDMMKEAKGVRDRDPAYAALLCDRTYAICARNKGRLKQAAQAAKMLIELVPAKERQSLEKLARVYLLAYQNIRKYDPRYKAAGQSLSEMFIRIGWLKALELDEEGALRDVRRGVSIATASEQLHLIDQGKLLEKRIPDIIAFEKHVAGSKAILRKTPKDPKANGTIALAYLVYQDDPKTALPYAKLGLPPEDAFKVQLAAEPLGSVSGDSYLDLAVWYMGHAIEHKSDVSHRVSMAIRARLYAEYYLSQISTGSIKGLKADGEIVRDRAKQLATSTGLTANDFDDMTGELAMELGTMESQAYRQAMDSAKGNFNGSKPKNNKKIEQKPIQVNKAPEIENVPTKVKPTRPKPTTATKKTPSKRKRSITKVEPPKYKGPGDGMAGGRSIFDF